MSLSYSSLSLLGSPLIGRIAERVPAPELWSTLTRIGALATPNGVRGLLDVSAGELAELADALDPATLAATAWLDHRAFFDAALRRLAAPPLARFRILSSRPEAGPFGPTPDAAVVADALRTWLPGGSVPFCEVRVVQGDGVDRVDVTRASLPCASVLVSQDGRRVTVTGRPLVVDTIVVDRESQALEIATTDRRALRAYGGAFGALLLAGGEPIEPSVTVSLLPVGNAARMGDGRGSGVGAVRILAVEARDADGTERVVRTRHGVDAESLPPRETWIGCSLAIDLGSQVHRIDLGPPMDVFSEGPLDPRVRRFLRAGGLVGGAA